MGVVIRWVQAQVKHTLGGGKAFGFGVVGKVIEVKEFSDVLLRAKRDT